MRTRWDATTTVLIMDYYWQAPHGWPARSLQTCAMRCTRTPLDRAAAIAWRPSADRAAGHAHAISMIGGKSARQQGKQRTSHTSSHQGSSGTLARWWPVQTATRFHPFEGIAASSRTQRQHYGSWRAISHGTLWSSKRRAFLRKCAQSASGSKRPAKPFQAGPGPALGRAERVVGRPPGAAASGGE